MYKLYRFSDNNVTTFNDWDLFKYNIPIKANGADVTLYELEREFDKHEYAHIIKALKILLYLPYVAVEVKHFSEPVFKTTSTFNKLCIVSNDSVTIRNINVVRENLSQPDFLMLIDHVRLTSYAEGVIFALHGNHVNIKGYKAFNKAYITISRADIIDEFLML